MPTSGTSGGNSSTGSRWFRAGATLANASSVTRIYDSIDALTGAMSYHRGRHAVLAGNVANLDTPGYRPADLERQVGVAAPASMTRTNDAHRSAGPAAEGRLVFDDGGALVGPDGNAVALERELAKIDANRVRDSTSAELVSRRLALLRYAASDGNT